MKPLVHPSVQDITVEGILHALSDPVRAAIFAAIASSACAHSCSNFLKVRKRSIPKSTLSQHFKALREAGLIRAERRGVEMHNTSRCAEINQRFPRLLQAILDAHLVQQESESRSPASKTRRRRSSVLRIQGRNG